MDFNFLWLITTIVLLFFSSKYLKKYKKAELVSTKRFYLGFGVFFSVYSITRIFFLFANYYYESGLSNTFEFELFTRMAYISGLFSISFLIFGVEMHFLKTKGFISIIPITLAILSIFMPYDILRVVVTISNILYLLIVVSLYIWIGIKSAGEIRKQAFISSLGLIIFFAGIFFDSRAMKITFTNLGLRWVVFLFCPLLVIIGLIIFYNASMNQNS